MDESDPKIFLEELNKEKELIEKYIKQLEDSIKDNETKYLQSTANGGNVLRGWEHIFTSKSNKIHMGNQIKKTHISNNEKLFSQTFDFDKNLDETINENDKHHHLGQSQSVSVNNSTTNLKLEENNNKSINGSNLNNAHVNGIVPKNNSNKRKKYLNRKRNADTNINDAQET